MQRSTAGRCFAVRMRWRMDRKAIKAVIAQYGQLKSEYAQLAALGLSARDEGATLKRKIDIIEAWFYLMSREERFVVRKHVVDRLSWPYVLAEYGTHWGKGLCRDERSLKRYQARAFRRIAETVREHDLEREIVSLFAM